ncbi:MAG: FtsX-like permease family protein, partial [Bacteroidota bacterium]
PATALTLPNSIVITESKARKYFPDGGAVGKMILLNDDTEKPMKVTGVIEDLPTNTHFNFDWAMTMAGVEFWPGEQNNWCCNNYHVYAKLKPEANKDDVIASLQRLKTHHIRPYQEKRSSPAEIAKMDKYFAVSMQPIADIHLHSGSKMDPTYTHGDIKIVWMFAAIAILIFVLASINFVNLSIAKSANRAKEVGLRKVVGSPKSMLISQFLVESTLFSLISFLLGILIAATLISYFNELTAKSLHIPFDQWYFFPLVAMLALLTGSVAGLYPAFFLSAFRPIEVIKGKLSRGAKGAGLQSILIIFQFTVSVVLIVGALVVNGQMDFILNKKLGYEKEQVLLLQGTNTLEEHLDTFRDGLKTISNVQNATISEYFPVSKTQRDQNPFWNEGMQREEEPVSAQFWRVDDQYISTLGMEIVKGRNFSSTMASDSNAIVINETMAKEFGFDDPIGKRITNGYTRRIVGIVKDFHFDLMTAEIRPLAFAPGQRPQMMAVRIASDNVSATLSSIGNLWDEYQPNQPIRYQFLSERYEQMYGNVKRTSEVFTIFAILAIVIACLGLFALSTFMVEQRRKEIGIRKILGASLQSLFGILTANFLKLVGIAFLVALPLAWYVMNYWLEGFEYKIGISWFEFALAGSTIFLIAIATMSYEVLRAVNNNPADTLHAE